jgi:LmbE family N-acetylglucosaminyl deacetylase
MAERKSSEKTFDFESCAVIVAHPDDETLWAGGTILMHPETRWTIISLCRKSDQDRASRFLRAMEYLRAGGEMGDLDDGPEQMPLAENEVEDTIVSLLSSDRFDLIITHGLYGEYTRHRRHEETAKAVCRLWKSGRLSARRMWMFAYEDGGGKKLPRPSRDADLKMKLSDDIWQKKYNIVTKIYGFGSDSFQAKAAGREEAFWSFEAGDDVERCFEKPALRRTTGGEEGQE